MAELSEILQKLIHQTEMNNVSWTTTADDDTFSAIVGELSVMSLTDLAGDFVLRIFNIDGRLIESLDSGAASGKNYADDLFSLNQMARRVTLGTDSTLDDLSRALDDLELPF